MLPALREIRVANEMRTPTVTSIGTYLASSYYIGDMDDNKPFNTLGNVVFISNSQHSITFKQVSSPQKLETVVTILQKRHNEMQVGKRMQVKTEGEKELRTGSDMSVEVTSKSNAKCNKCGNFNPNGSIFCNKCGTMLQPKCSKCNHLNPTESFFCNHCGSKLNVSDPNPNIKASRISQSLDDSVSEDNFLEYTMPEHHLKINYPATWTKVDNNIPDPFTKVMFFSPKEDQNDSFLDGLGVGVQNLPPNTTLEDCVEVNVRDLQKNNSDLALLESTSTTLATFPDSSDGLH